MYVRCVRCGGNGFVFGLEESEKCPECYGNGQIVICRDPVLRQQKVEDLTRLNSWEEMRKTPSEWAYDVTEIRARLRTKENSQED